MKTKIHAALTLMVFWAAAAGADDKTGALATLAPGDRVRVEVKGDRDTLIATIESVTADELVLKS
ncbi:MAG TPA: hypothetical protein PKU70_07500, partial [Vicinamibacteria bacterium]|nr:hypothetical protein [Vicinamibacteria bacterium]